MAWRNWLGSLKNRKFDPMKDLEEIKDILVQNKKRLIDKYAIKNLAVFGSYIRDEQKTDSDIDILVEFSDKIGIRFIDLGDELEDILKIKVDLVSKNGIKPKYLKSISSSLIYV